MNTCKICRKKVRKTVIANIIQKGQVTTGRICSKCAADGVLLCAPGDKPLTCSCGDGPALVCGKCVTKAEHQAVKKAVDLKKHVKHLKGLVKAYKNSGRADDDERILGLEMAIDYLESVPATLKD